MSLDLWRFRLIVTWYHRFLEKLWAYSSSPRQNAGPHIHATSQMVEGSVRTLHPTSGSFQDACSSTSALGVPCFLARGQPRPVVCIPIKRRLFPPGNLPAILVYHNSYLFIILFFLLSIGTWKDSKSSRCPNSVFATLLSNQTECLSQYIIC